MNTIAITVNKMAITRVCAPVMASNSQKYIECDFTFDEDWDGHTKQAVFTINGTDVHTILLVDDKCIMPHPVSAHVGEVKIAVRGIKGDQVITTVAKSVMLEYALDDGIDPTIEYVIQYDSNASSEEVTERAYNGGDIAVILASSFANPPLVFKDWNTRADGSGLSYAPGIEIEMTDNIVLYAQWGSGDTSLTAHDELTADSRALPDQHPIEAITGLDTELFDKATKSDVANIEYNFYIATGALDSVKADKANTYTKEESDTLVNTLAPQIETAQQTATKADDKANSLEQQLNALTLRVEALENQ